MESDIIDMYQNAQDADEWRQRVKTQIAPWIKVKGKSYWDFVRFFLYKKGVLECLSREKFAKWLTNECPEALADGDTEDSLFQIMRKFCFKEQLRKRTKAERAKQAPNKEFVFDLLPDSNACKTLFSELEKTCSNPLTEEPLTVEQKLEELLNEYVNQQSGKHPYAKVFAHPEYCGYRPALSIEYYLNEDFALNREATFIQIYEMTDVPITKETVTQLAGRYMEMKFAKLVITTPYGIDNATRAAASDRKVSILRIDPKRQIKDSDFVLSRHIGSAEKQRQEWLMMTGKTPMTTPYIMMDEYGTTTSLADFLSNQGVPVKPGYCLKAPWLRDEDIESMACSFVQPKIDEFVRRMKVTRSPQYFDADPFQIANDMGISVERNWHEESTQLGYLDVKERKVVLNFRPNTNENRMRFTLAHELGHAYLHGSLNIDSFGDNDDLLFNPHAILNNEQKWFEHHANHFAACLLMPADVVGYLFGFYCQKVFGRNIIQPITINRYNPDKEKTFLKIALPMSKLMGVSVDAVRMRLLKLNFATKETVEKSVHGLKKLSDLF